MNVMLCPSLCLIEDRQFRIPNYPIKMLIIPYLDKAFPVEGSCYGRCSPSCLPPRPPQTPLLPLPLVSEAGPLGFPHPGLLSPSTSCYFAPETGWSHKSLQTLCTDVEGVIIAPSATRIYATQSPSLHDLNQSFQDRSIKGAISTHTSDRPEALEAFKSETEDPKP